MKPIFIVGNSRSGTSMMGRILGNHHLVYTIPHEIHFFEELWDPSQGDEPLPSREAVGMLSRLLCVAAEGYLKHDDPSRYEAVAMEILQTGGGAAIDIYRIFLEHTAHSKGSEYVCDQTPNYLLFAGDILAIFPECFIVNMVRDPRDILLSQKNKWRIRGYGNKDGIPLKESIRSWINYHPYTMSLLWKRNVTAAAVFQEYPRFITVRYEDLVVSPDATMAALCDKLGFSFDKEMLRIGVQGSSTTKPSQEKTGVVDFREKWKKGGLSRTELFICEWALGPVMKNQGYNVSGARPNVVSVAGSFLLFLLKTPLAVAFNLSRTKNIWQAVCRRLGLQKRGDETS